MRVFIFTTLTMIAFAANSVFGRLALDGTSGTTSIDAASYALIRLAAGAIMLAGLVMVHAAREDERTSGNGWRSSVMEGNWLSAIALFAYAAAFSFSYLRLETGIGALILFACVQGTMIGWALVKGDRPLLLEWFGLVVAFGAFIWLCSPGLSAPDAMGALLMALSGVAWGIYSLRGKDVVDPLRSTAGNFIRSVPITVALSALLWANSSLMKITLFGFSMAVLSGAITSALGYALWYRTLRDLSTTQASITQLTVPVLAGIGGLALLGEAITMRFVIASVLILGGVGIAILAKSKRA